MSPSPVAWTLATVALAAVALAAVALSTSSDVRLWLTRQSVPSRLLDRMMDALHASRYNIGTLMLYALMGYQIKSIK